MENHVPDRVGPDSYRTTARIVGILYLAGMVVGVGGNILIQSILAAPDHLAAVTQNGLSLAIGAMLILMAGLWDAAHGILMFPILKQHHERIALGYLAARIVDAVFIAVMVLFVLLRAETGPADEDARHRFNMMGVLTLPRGFQTGMVLWVRSGVPYDIITGLDGKPVTASQELNELVAGMAPGQKVTVAITHTDGSTATVTLTIGQYPG